MLDLIAEKATSSGDEEKARYLQSLKEPVWTGIIVYRYLIPMDRLREINPNHSSLFLAQNVSSLHITALATFAAY